MTNGKNVILYRPRTIRTTDPEHWKAEGRKLALTDPIGVLETIEVIHTAEAIDHNALAKNIEARGGSTHGHWTVINDRLTALNFDAADHLHQLAQAEFDLRVAGALLAVGGGLTAFVLFAYAPLLLTVLMAFLVLASATAVEEFFQAHQEKAALREGIFLALAFLALGAQLWLGTLRGVLIGAVAPATSGPASEALGIGALVLRYTLGIFSLVAEVVAGYKFWRARSAFLSPTAQAVRDRAHHESELLDLRDAFERAKVEADIRRHYRLIGARDELARTAGADARHRDNHLKRALKGALLAVVIVALLLFLVSRGSAAPLPTRNKAVLLDLSRSETVQDLKANIDATSAILSELRTGDRIVVVGISSGFGRPLFLLDETMPSDAGHYGLHEQTSRESIIAKWKQVSKDLKPSFPTTDILGALSALSFLSDFDLRGAQIYLLSDMQQSTPEIDLEHTALIPVAQMMIKLKRTDGFPALKGAEIFALGVDPVGKNRTYYSTLREFWSTYFRECGAELRIFAIDRRIPDLNRIR